MHCQRFSGGAAAVIILLLFKIQEILFPFAQSTSTLEFLV